jgi:AcrR family transcriptional regulator
VADPQHPGAALDERLLDAAEKVLGSSGWDGLQVERVAAAAGLSRVTAWRQGATRERLVAGLLARLDEDYRQSIWKALTAAGSARERLETALRALWDVADRHLPALMASDNVLHASFRNSLPEVPKTDFVGPFIRLLRDGAVDGTLRRTDDVVDSAEALFNLACWSYVHLRGRHGWSAARTRRHLQRILVDGVVPRPE